MGEKTDSIINSIVKNLREGPKSISDISKECAINWRTATEYLNIMKTLGLVKEKQIRNTRSFLLQDKDNYFRLPIKKKDDELITTIYYHISQSFNPTKTQAYKILWKVKNELDLKIPIGWYKYGPCCVKVYTGKETRLIKLTDTQIRKINEVTKDLCRYDNLTLQSIIYDEEDEKLYLTKEKLLKTPENKDSLNSLLMDLIKYCPKECTNITTDFTRATLLLGWHVMQEIFFNHLWKYIALVKFKESLKFYYGDSINDYLDEQIESKRLEAQVLIDEKILNYTDSKHSQDKLYQRWVKKKK